MEELSWWLWVSANVKKWTICLTKIEYSWLTTFQYQSQTFPIHSRISWTSLVQIQDILWNHIKLVNLYIDYEIGNMANIEIPFPACSKSYLKIISPRQTAWLNYFLAVRNDKGTRFDFWLKHINTVMQELYTRTLKKLHKRIVAWLNVASRQHSCQA